jgi:hypothetical protein
MMWRVEWRITLDANEDDVQRLLASDIDDLSAVEGEADRLVLTINSPDGVTPEDEPGAVEVELQAFVTRLNGVGRVRWGKAFKGVMVIDRQSVDADGNITGHIYVDSATGHMLPEEFANFVESLGYERPPMPKGLEHIEHLDFGHALEAAESTPAVARVVQLVDLMLTDDDEINWSAAYAALETIEHELEGHGVDGQALGWWSKAERGAFRATANSPEVLGVRARHGKPTGLTEGRMSSGEAGWFTRRIAALWIASPYARSKPEAEVEGD